MVSYLGMLRQFWADCCVVLEKPIARNIFSLYQLSDGKKHFIIQDMLTQSLWIFQT